MRVSLSKLPRSWPGLSLLASALLIAVACSNAEPPESAKPAEAKAATPPSVAITFPLEDSVPEFIEAHGNIMPWQETRISSEIGGLRLAQVLVTTGDHVSKGQILAHLDASSVEMDIDTANAQLAETEAALAQAVGTLERARRLAPTGSVSQQELTLYETQKNTAEARVNAAKAQVKRQQLKLTHASLVAPDDGIITAVSATEGMLVQGGNELFRLIRQGRLEWRAEVKGEILLKLVPGQTVSVSSPLGGEVKGKIRRLSPTIDVATRMGIAYIDLPADTNLKAGLNVGGKIFTGKHQGLFVPETAVVYEQKQARLKIVTEDHKLAFIEVATGSKRNGLIEITGPLNANTQVVVGKTTGLTMGASVTPVIEQAK